MTQQRKEQLQAEAAVAAQTKEHQHNDTTSASDSGGSGGNVSSSPSPSPSKYVVAQKTTAANAIEDMFVPLAVYNDGAHFGDERIRPMTINARVLVLNVSDFFVLPSDELHHLYMMYTDDAFAFQSNAEKRVRVLCKAAKNIIQPPPRRYTPPSSPSAPVAAPSPSPLSKTVRLSLDDSLTQDRLHELQKLILMQQQITQRRNATI